MDPNDQRLDAQGVLALRREGGRWIRDLRAAAGLSQREMAATLGTDYYTFVSQVETGRRRIPSDRYRDWADALRGTRHLSTGASRVSQAQLLAHSSVGPLKGRTHAQHTIELRD